MIAEITTWIEQNFNISPDFQTRLFYTLVVIILIVLLRIISSAILHRRIDDTASLFRWRKNTSYVFWAVGIFLVSMIWLRGASSLATYLGLVSAALVIALQDPISNLVAWIFIISRRPFEIEDRIQIGNDAGDVVDIRFFQFSLNEIGNWVDADQSTGRVLHIPNKKVFNENVANFTQGFDFLWNEIPVVVTFESDWRKGKELLLKIAEHNSAAQSAAARASGAPNRYLIYYKNLTPIVYTKVVDHGIMLTIRYLSAPQQRRGSEEAIWEEILDTFDGDPTLEFAYPTQRIYYNPAEGPQASQPGSAPEMGVKLDE